MISQAGGSLKSWILRLLDGHLQHTWKKSKRLYRLPLRLSRQDRRLHPHQPLPRELMVPMAKSHPLRLAKDPLEGSRLLLRLVHQETVGMELMEVKVEHLHLPVVVAGGSPEVWLLR